MARRNSILYCLLLFLVVMPPPSLRAGNWPGWRGPEGIGVSADKDLPLRWGTDENVRWRVDLPGPGNSSPVVWGDRVFVTQAVEDENRRTVMCFDRANGKLLCSRPVGRRGRAVRDMPCDDTLYAHGTINLRTGEVIEAFRVPADARGPSFAALDCIVTAFGGVAPSTAKRCKRRI